MRVIRDCKKFPRQLLISFLQYECTLGYDYFLNYFNIYAHILLTKSNNQIQNCESWILTILTSKIAFDKQVHNSKW